MRWLLLTTLLQLGFLLSQSQSLEKYVFNSGGQYSEASENEVQVSFGEPLVSLRQANSVKVSDGFLFRTKQYPNAVVEINTIESGQIFPNPSNGEFFYYSEESIENAQLQLFDAIGSSVYRIDMEIVRGNNRMKQIDKPGFYTLVIHSGKTNSIFRLIVE